MGCCSAWFSHVRFQADDTLMQHIDATHDALLAHFSLHVPVANAVLLVFLMLLDMQVTIDFVASVNESHQQSFPLFHPDSVTPKSPVDLQKTYF